MLILRLRQPARSKEQGNSFAGGQGADLHRCLHRERTATSTPSRLTFAVNKICVNLRNLWFNFFYLVSVVSEFTRHCLGGLSVAKTKYRFYPRKSVSICG
jgi:hypothetical protein